jgi:hypothetical protein
MNRRGFLAATAALLITPTLTSKAQQAGKVPRVGFLYQLYRSETNGEPLAQRATTTIPIITMSRDPVAEGLVASVGRPGGNITGVRLPLAEQAAKRLQREKIYLKWCSTGDSEET